MVRIYWELLKALPAIIEFLKALQKAKQQRDDETKLSEDVKVIQKAFEERDAEKLNALFNSK